MTPANRSPRRADRNEKMVRVSAARPCPVCGKPDWCLLAADGSACICARVESGSAKTCGEAGYLHRLAQTVDGFESPKRVPARSKDWTTIASEMASQFTLVQRRDLAERLRLPAEVFDALPLIGVADENAKGTTISFPECDAAGKVIGMLRRLPDGSKKAMGGGRRGLTLPVGWADRPGPLFVVEGPTDALAMTAAGLASIGRPSNRGGAELLAELLADWPAERMIVVVGERDKKPNGNWPGRDGAVSVARDLTRRLRRPIGWTLPPVGSKDVRDWLTYSDRGETPWADRGKELDAALLASVEVINPAGEKQRGPSDPDPPEIIVGTDEYRVNAAATVSLSHAQGIYQRGGMLVHVLEQQADSEPNAVVRRPVGATVVRPLPRSLLREHLTRSASWQRWKGAGENVQLVPAHPPDWCVGAVFDRGHWPGVRHLAAVVSHPVVLPDGSILSVSGYHPATGLLACIPPGLSVSLSDKPNRSDVASAVEELLDPVSDLPFETPSHRSAWVAGLLTPLAWYLFDGPAPLFLTDANIRAAGKGLSVDVIALIVTGRRFPVMSYTPDREELRKRITTLAVEGERAVLLDNLAGPVGNDVLDAALTADTWKDRVLGSNKGYDGPLHVVWYATGNNVQLQADTSRRTCHIRLESPDERPETKSGFKYPNLREHVRLNRGRLLSAALTILRGWLIAGRPRHGLPTWGSFEAWSSVVREAVVFAGLSDPGETRLALQTAADRDAVSMGIILRCLHELDADRRGLTTTQIIVRLKDSSESPPAWHGDFRAAVEELCGRLDSHRLGYKFRHFARRNFDGRMLDQAGSTAGSNRWVVVSASARRPNDVPHRPDLPSGVLAQRGDGGDRGDVPAGIGRSRSADADPKRSD